MQGIAGDKGGSAPWLLGLWLSPQVDQDGTTASPIARFHVVEDISNEPGALQVEIEICCSLQQHTWLRLAAGAAHRQIFGHPFPVMMAVSTPGTRMAGSAMHSRRFGRSPVTAITVIRHRCASAAARTRFSESPLVLKAISMSAGRPSARTWRANTSWYP